MKRHAQVVVMLAAPFVLSACVLSVPELENAAIQGRWSLTLKNEEDQCMFNGWMPGALATFDIVIDQFGAKGRDVSARLDGFLGLAFWIGLGTADLSGRIEGDQLSLTMLGINNETAADGCVFKREIRVTAQVEGDRLTRGRISHIPTGSSGDACQMYKTCRAVQTFDGRRLGE